VEIVVVSIVNIIYVKQSRVRRIRKRFDVKEYYSGYERTSLGTVYAYKINYISTTCE
jgi:hypothetical protein